MNQSSDSLFLTGKAGTGKSTLIEYFLQTTERDVLVLAPTGVAAVNVGGVTIHSFFGIHPGITVDEARDGEYHLSGSKIDVLENLDAIVIDEISMVRADVLDVVNEILQQFYENSLPFGGKQMIFVGDVYQLPPVVRGDEYTYFNEVYGSPYFFSTQCYQDLAPKTIELQHIYRQDNDAFKSVLNKIRL
jgi:ATP-dependent exoDNAse (exonuclease V) alpha subunit